VRGAVVLPGRPDPGYPLPGVGWARLLMLLVGIAVLVAAFACQAEGYAMDARVRRAGWTAGWHALGAAAGVLAVRQLGGWATPALVAEVVLLGTGAVAWALVALRRRRAGGAGLGWLVAPVALLLVAGLVGWLVSGGTRRTWMTSTGRPNCCA
jgi:hypothetical protein